MKTFVFRMLVFTAGAVTLGVELSAARLLEPWFGNSQIVWAALIGLILSYLAIGAWLGGKLADRFPSLGGLLTIMTLAGLGVALTPTVSPPVLRLAAVGLNDYIPGLLAGALLVVLLLFSLPVILLGAVSPWAVRLAVTDLQQTGRVAGHLYAIGACGSIIGTFLPVLWLIPSYGTRWSFYLLALWLLAVTLLAALLHGRSRRLPGLALLALCATLALALTDSGSVRANWDSRDDSPILYEDESLYNYILFGHGAASATFSSTKASASTASTTPTACSARAYGTISCWPLTFDLTSGSARTSASLSSGWPPAPRPICTRKSTARLTLSASNWILRLSQWGGVTLT